MKNKYFITMMVCFLLLCTACSNKFEEIKPNEKGTHLSIKEYSKLETQEYEGEYFSIKAIDIVEVPFERDDHSIITFYRYRIAICPKYKKEMKIKKIEVSPIDSAIEKYLNGSSPIGSGNLKIWNSLSDKLDIAQGQDNDFIAYEMDITFNDLTDTYMAKSGITREALENAIKNIKVSISYDNSVDEIELKNIVILPHVDKSVSEREDVIELTNNGTTFDGINPYEGKNKDM